MDVYHQDDEIRPPYEIVDGRRYPAPDHPFGPNIGPCNDPRCVSCMAKRLSTHREIRARLYHVSSIMHEILACRRAPSKATYGQAHRLILDLIADLV